MTSRKFAAFGLAALLLSTSFAAAADAATRAKHLRHHRPGHAVHASRSHGRAAATTSADHSADSLNSQSLARAQGQ